MNFYSKLLYKNYSNLLATLLHDIYSNFLQCSKSARRKIGRHCGVHVNGCVAVETVYKRKVSAVIFVSHKKFINEMLYWIKYSTENQWAFFI